MSVQGFPRFPAVWKLSLASVADASFQVSQFAESTSLWQQTLEVTLERQQGRRWGSAVVNQGKMLQNQHFLQQFVLHENFIQPGPKANTRENPRRRSAVLSSEWYPVRKAHTFARPGKEKAGGWSAGTYTSTIPAAGCVQHLLQERGLRSLGTTTAYRQLSKACFILRYSSSNQGKFSKNMPARKAH